MPGLMVRQGVAMIVAMFLLPCLVSTMARASGASQAAQTGPPVITSIPFRAYRIPASMSPEAHRDFEFLWSSNYTALGNDSLTHRYGGLSLLDSLGLSLSRKNANRLGYNVSDVELLYDYLKMPDPYHAASSYADSGIRVSLTPGTLDANHFDIYLYVPKDFQTYGDAILGDGQATKSNARYNYGQSFSDFWSNAEDTSSGHPLGLSSKADHGNSLMWAGPRLSAGTSPAWVNEGNMTGMVHELQHVMNGNKPARYTEIFSRAAEMLCGFADSSYYDFRYTLGLLPTYPGDSLAPVANYEAWEPFAAYLIYNFQGVQQGYAGRADDLIWRWAHSPDRTFYGLALVLDSLACPTCGYLGGLSPAERVGTLVHNWRVANFVDNFALANHQYGYNPAYGFHPRIQMGAFQDRDDYAANNNETLPLELTALPSWRTREVAVDRYPASNGQFGDRKLSIPLWGSECGVIHASSLLGGNDTLNVTVSPESLATFVYGDSSSAACDTSWIAPFKRGRMRVSLVRYSQDAPDLFNHPEWVLGVETKAVDVSVPSAGVSFQVNGFGGATRAAVLIVTLEGLDELALQGDLPVRSYLGQQLPIRISAGLGGADLVPRLVAGLTRNEDHGAWTADGRSIVFETSTLLDTTRTQLYKVAEGGGIALPLWNQPHSQRRADCSARGDLVAFEQDSAANVPKVWLMGVDGSAPHRLTSAPGRETAPAFSPNGQQVAYCWLPMPGVNGTPAGVRIANLDGSGVHDLGGGANATVRWADDGKSVYVTAAEATAQPVYRIGLAPDAGGEYGVVPATLFGNVYDFDIRPASNDFLVGRDNFGYGYRCAPSNTCPECLGRGDITKVLPGRRIVTDLFLPGTAARDTATQFPLQGATAMHARWSPDGTKLLYSADRTVAGNLDLYIGALTRNRPPVFTPASTADASGPVFIRDLAAVDPEGQSVRYDAAPLPNGATLSGNRLRWTPGPGQEGSYFIRLRATDDGGAVASAVIKVTIGSDTEVVPPAVTQPTTLDTAERLPLRFGLGAIEPNPAKGASQITLALPYATDVHVGVLDTQGRLVRTLHDGTLGAGYRRLAWNGRNDSGQSVPPGVYFIRMQAGEFTGRKRIVVVH